MNSPHSLLQSLLPEIQRNPQLLGILAQSMGGGGQGVGGILGGQPPQALAGGPPMRQAPQPMPQAQPAPMTVSAPRMGQGGPRASGWRDMARLVAAGIGDYRGGNDLAMLRDEWTKRDAAGPAAARQQELMTAARASITDPREWSVFLADPEAWAKSRAKGYEPLVVANESSVFNERGFQRPDPVDYTMKPGEVRFGGQNNRVVASAPFAPEVVTNKPGEVSTLVTKGRGAPSVDDLFGALVQQESGGRPGAIGPQTPYGQAQGASQMLPQTAQAMATKLNLPWRPDLMTGTSPEAEQYQLALGRAYFDEGMQKYGGDPEKALMYYHGGPDESLWGPKTREYARAVMARAGGPSSQVVATGGPRQGWTTDPSGQFQTSPDGEIKAMPRPAMPPALQTKEDEDLAAIEAGSGINGLLGNYQTQIETGTMNLGPVENAWSPVARWAGKASPNDIAVGSFKAGLERMRNDSLRLNKGIQTEGDAQRAWNELFTNTNDENFVLQRLKEIQAINKRAVDIRQANIALRRERSGLPPIGDISAFEAPLQMPQIGDQSGQAAPPAAAPAPAPATRGAPRTGKADPFPGIKDGAVVRQGTKRYRRQGDQMVEVP